jgi:ATP-dependent protease ClpP protease subunit
MSTPIPEVNSPISAKDQDLLDITKSKDIYNKALESYINVKLEDNKELGPILQKVADKNKVVLLAFIAPSFSKKVSPYESLPASIKTFEELGVEKAICDIKSSLEEKGFKGKPNLFLLVNSPGGWVSSSRVIAKMIRDNFENVTVFVPHTAASGGTLLTFAGNEIVMGEMSRLSPIDTQISYQGGRVSAQSFGRAFTKFNEYFKDKNPYEVPYPWKSMAEKFDPIIQNEWEALLNELWSYTWSLLKKSKYTEDKIGLIGYNLIWTQYPHGYIVDRETALNIGLNVKTDGDYPLAWSALKAWFGIYSIEAETKHFIRYAIYTP